MAYPIQIPSGCPSYVSKSVQDQCNRALNLVLVENITAERAQENAFHHMRDELTTMRNAHDGKCGSMKEWLDWGFRTVTNAYNDAWSLAAFRDALIREDLSHVTSGHPVNPNTYHAYRRDSSSPSGCMLVASASHDLPGVDQILAAHTVRVCQGGQRGEQACRAALRG